MKKLSFLILILTVLLPSTIVLAKDKGTSEDYLKYCQESVKFFNKETADKLAAGICLGFINGAIGMHHAHTVTDKTNLFFCLPENGLSTIDIIKLWVKYLEKNHQAQKFEPIVTFSAAMTEAFPCDADNKK